MSVRSRNKKARSFQDNTLVKEKNKFLTPLLWWGFFILFMLGLSLRLCHLNRNVFYFYDEGMYLNFGRVNVDSLIQHSVLRLEDIFFNIGQWFSLGTQTDRPLWQLMVDSRVFFGWTQKWWIVRGLSCVMGLGTLALLYRFAQRFFSSRLTAVLSVLFLLFLPSHIFYSRAALPEAATALFVLLGFYFYCFPRVFGWRTFLAGLFFTCAFFTNYRLLVLPVLTFAGEFLLSKADRRSLDFRKWGWTVLVFVLFIFLACLINNGAYFVETSGWMMHQVELAREHFTWSSIFTYPYILFRLESWAFGLLFLGGAYFVWKKDWLKAFPFLLVFLQMAMFSFSSDKAVRYLSVVLPFMALAAAVTVSAVMESATNKMLRRFVIGLAVVAVGTMAFKSFQLITNKSSHKKLHEYLIGLDPKVKIVTTQPLVVGLDFDDIHNIVACPGVRDAAFLKLPEAGFRYLVLGPQAYVSWTESGVSFDGELSGFLLFFDKKVPPIKTFPHLNKTMLERFVFEHNQNLMGSITFLQEADEDAGQRRVYDVKQGLDMMKAALEKRAAR